LDRATAAVGHPSHGFMHLNRKSNEGATKGNLGAIRSAVSSYYGKAQGVFPASLDGLTAGGKHLPAMPPAKIPPHHADSNKILNLTGAQYAREEWDDTGGWAYVLDGPDQGKVFVNCAHTDTRGSVWNSY
jgi:hypothetical protein